MTVVCGLQCPSRVISVGAGQAVSSFALGAAQAINIRIEWCTEWCECSAQQEYGCEFGVF